MTYDDENYLLDVDKVMNEVKDALGRRDYKRLEYLAENIGDPCSFETTTLESIIYSGFVSHVYSVNMERIKIHYEG